MVIDDDPGVRDSLGKLLRSAGFRVSLFGSVSEFCAADRPGGPTCLVLDVRLPGQSGLELQRELAVEVGQILRQAASCAPESNRPSWQRTTFV